MSIAISTGKVVRLLVSVVLCLTLANLVSQLYGQGVIEGREWLPGNGDGRLEAFDVNQEGNLPTWYSSSALLLCSVLLALIAAGARQSRGHYVRHWSALSAIFLLFSLDEVATFHERIGGLLRGIFDTGGVLYYAWVAPASAFLLVFVAAYLRFFASLPAKTRLLVLIAGVCLAGGVLVPGMIEGYYADRYGTSGLAYAMMVSGEELLEMTGVVVFIYALMSYIAVHFREVTLRIGGK